MNVVFYKSLFDLKLLLKTEALCLGNGLTEHVGAAIISSFYWILTQLK